MLLESFSDYLLSTYCVQLAVLAPDTQTPLLVLFQLRCPSASLPPIPEVLLLDLTLQAVYDTVCPPWSWGQWTGLGFPVEDLGLALSLV